MNMHYVDVETILVNYSKKIWTPINQVYAITNELFKEKSGHKLENSIVWESIEEQF